MNSQRHAYVIQRKSDGKFFRNDRHYHYRSILQREDMYWVSKSQATLFKSIRAAKSSRVWIGKKWVCSEKGCESGRWYDCYDCTHGGWVNRTDDELPYRVVKVIVSVELK